MQYEDFLHAFFLLDLVQILFLLYSLPFSPRFFRNVNYIPIISITQDSGTNVFAPEHTKYYLLLFIFLLTIKIRIECVEILAVKILLYHTKCLTKTLEMYNLSGSQKADWICHFRIFGKSKNIIICFSRLLFRRHILHKIRNRITRTLELRCAEWYTTGCLRPYRCCMVNIIRSKTRSSIDFIIAYLQHKKKLFIKFLYSIIS